LKCVKNTTRIYILLRGKTIWLSIKSKHISSRIDNSPCFVIAIRQLDSCDCGVIWGCKLHCLVFLGEVCRFQTANEKPVFVLLRAPSGNRKGSLQYREVKTFLLQKREALKLFSKKTNMENMEILDKYFCCKY